MKTLEKSLAALEYFASCGVAGATFTPHVMEGVHNTRESLLKVFDEFKEGYALGIESNVLQIRLGAEYMLDNKFPSHLDEGLLTISNTIVLLETSYFQAPNNMEEMLYDVDSGDLIPAIAHPERYIYMGMKDYERLKEKDYYLQLNLLSLTGAYGEDARSKAFDLLRRGMYDFVGTDVHHLTPFVQKLEKLRVDPAQMEALDKLKANNGKLFENK
jgi:Capsular polysaccharide biosynthesis protein